MIEYVVRREMRKTQHIHFVGIGGIGMCGIAEVLLSEGYCVSGSDLSSTLITERLQKLGAKIYKGHDAQYIEGADVVVFSSAVKSDNPELLAAQKQRIPIIHRAEMLAELMRFRSGIAIAGTHGKTTTTSLATSLLIEAGFDPTFVIGGRLSSAETTGRLGLGRYLVVEADESDASFLQLTPTISVVTNIDEDHMETYEYDLNKLYETFITFLHHLPFYGFAILCFDDPGVQTILPKISRPILTYGLKEGADVRAVDIVLAGDNIHFTVQRPKPYPDLPIQLNLAGEHNILNALAAMCIAMDLGISDEVVYHTFKQFAGIDRRFQRLGYYHFSRGSSLIVDDYGHNPKKIGASINAARQSWPDRRIVMMFQPHRYTRTRDLLQAFADVLIKVDVLLLFDVYAAGEDPLPEADTPYLCQQIEKRGIIKPYYISAEDDLSEVLENLLQDGDILISQGAGSISAIAKELLEKQKVK